MNTKLITTKANASIIVPVNATKDTKSRLTRYARFQEQSGQDWHNIDLTKYRDELSLSLSPASVSAHLSTVRSRYRAMLRDPQRRDDLYTLAGERLQKLDQEDTPANRSAFVNEIEIRIMNALDPKEASVKVVTKQDTPDSEHIRLTSEQANDLMRAPGTSTLRGVRDTAIIALMLCTGIREMELCNLEVKDLRQKYDNELALHVRLGKGKKDRMIPYGALSGVLCLVDQWMEKASIETGYIFRGIHRSGLVLENKLSVRSVQYLLDRYSVVIDGKLTKVKPHDCRRTYARRMHESGIDLVAIQQNLGHKDSDTTLGYIGKLDGKSRRPKAMYNLNLSSSNT